jgi:hypothetical protein
MNFNKIFIITAINFMQNCILYRSLKVGVIFCMICVFLYVMS